MIPDIETLMVFARALKGEPLQTIWRKKTFYINLIGDDLEFIPVSSRAPRRERYDQIKALLDELTETGSFRKSDYADLSFNASYVLALVKQWQTAQ
ncbi:MAG: 5-methylcytosine-specific restriction enzyme [Pseudomonadota bacterium]|nr:5-methylcytosine-specific restriction enzyme [Pseudomonadota bacterium]